MRARIAAIRLAACLAALSVLAAACGGDGAPALDPAAACAAEDGGPDGPLCARQVATDEQFDRLSLPTAGVPGWVRGTKYMVPATDDPAAIPALVQNANRYDVHRDFLRAVFLPDLNLVSYARLVSQRATRAYYAGDLVRVEDPARGRFYGFTIHTAARTSELLEPAEVRQVYERLGAVVTAGPLAFTFEPSDLLGPERARTWADPGFPILYLDDDGAPVEVYTAGTAYGTVRLFPVAALEEAVAAGTVGARDLVVVDAVPFDIETVVAGLVTGGRQWELSHVNVRLARRGTPNLYVADALAALAPWEGRLVRLDARQAPGGAGNDGYAVTPAGLAEAEAWWAAERPSLASVPAIDGAFRALDGLREMDTDDQPVPLVQRYGGKAAHLAKLYAFLPTVHQVPGFGVPFAYFEDFLDRTTVPDPRLDPPEEVTLRELVRRLAADPRVAADAVLRHELLAVVREHIRSGGSVPPALVEALAARITEVFGAPDVRVRFRSSSNVEDDLEFSGAGLYDSTTVCAADSLDDDVVGPSLCDPDQPDERDIERGLRRVWASLYGDRAWDERDWYQVPQDAAGMAVLVTLGFPDEAANGVAFTGDPGAPDDPRYVVNVQLGDEPVVSNDAATFPELDKLTLEDGRVTRIDRLRASSLATPGVPVLDDGRLRELGALLAAVEAAFPLDTGDHARSEVLLDVEFKIERGTGTLKLKQLRPFLRP